LVALRERSFYPVAAESSCFIHLIHWITGNWEAGIMTKQYKTTRHKFTKRRDENFRTAKPAKQRYKNPKRKLNKHEVEFIRTYGRELYNKLRASRPELRKRPHTFKLMLRAGELFGLGYYQLLIEGDD